MPSTQNLTCFRCLINNQVGRIFFNETETLMICSVHSYISQPFSFKLLKAHSLLTQGLSLFVFTDT